MIYKRTHEQMTSPWIEYIVTLLVWGGEMSELNAVHAHGGEGIFRNYIAFRGNGGGSVVAIPTNPYSPLFPP